MLKAHRFHIKFTVHTIMSEGGDVTMEEDYTLSYRTEEIPGFSLDISISLPTFAVSIKLITLKLKCYGKLARISF